MIFNTCTLQQWREHKLYREPSTIDGYAGKCLFKDNQTYLSFISNDYLSLSHHPKIKKAAQQAIAQYGSSAHTSAMVYGHTHIHEQLAQVIAQQVQQEAALLFSSGYMANISLMQALLADGYHIVLDKHCHNSFMMACSNHPKQYHRYLHNDMLALEKRLQRLQGHKKIVLSNGIFSMTGHMPPITVLSALARQYQAPLVLDDAHGVGILGHSGGGISEYASDHAIINIITGSFAKACAGQGGFIAADQQTIDHLRQFAHPYMYSTALPPVIAACNLAALQIIPQENDRRQKLNTLIQYFQNKAQHLKLPILPSQTPIQAILTKSIDKTLQLAQDLKHQNILVAPIRPPSVPKTQCQLRICLTASHEQSDLNILLEALFKSVSL